MMTRIGGSQSLEEHGKARTNRDEYHREIYIDPDSSHRLSRLKLPFRLFVIFKDHRPHLIIVHGCRVALGPLPRDCGQRPLRTPLSGKAYAELRSSPFHSFEGHAIQSPGLGEA